MTARLAALLLAALLAAPACADTEGKLAAFEADATARDRHRYSERRDDSCLSFLLADILSDVLGPAVVYGGAASLGRVTGDTRLGLDSVPREPGEPLIPFARLDAAWQAVESDVEALDVRVEGGYGPVGLHVNATRYWEDEPDDELDLLRVLGLYRMSFGSAVEVDVGFGALTIHGDATTTKPAFSLRVLVHPGDHWGVEFRPFLADRMVDCDMRPPLDRFAPHANARPDEQWWDDDETNDPDPVTVRIHEANYAWYDQRQAAAGAGIPFFGTHGEGGEYGGYAFASLDGEQVEAPLNHDGYMVIVVDDDLQPVDDIEELRAYLAKLRAVKKLLGMEVQDGEPSPDQQAERAALPAGLCAA